MMDHLKRNTWAEKKLPRYGDPRFAQADILYGAAWGPPDPLPPPRPAPVIPRRTARAATRAK